MESFLHLAKKRYSCRNYLKVPVKDDDLAYLLEAGRIAPSAKNYQPWIFLVINDPVIREKANVLYHREWFKEAPVIIVFIADHQQVALRSTDGKSYADVDVSIAIDHVTLAAADRGLGTCWIGSFDVIATKELFNLPDTMEPIALLTVGYPADKPDLQRHRIRRKPISEIVRFNKL